MEKWYITKKTSETGKKFQYISQRRKEAIEAQKAFAKKYNFEQVRACYGMVWGGISSCVNFEQPPDSKLWKNSGYLGEFMPKKNTREGKAICREIDSLPTISKHELNMCIGFDGAPFSTIGYAGNNETYFAFGVDDTWKVSIPEDCEEVTRSKYDKLFKKER